MNEPAEMIPGKIGLTVITYNRLDYLKQVIAALDKNNWGGAEYRAVVDDKSTNEGYAEYLAELAQRTDLVVLSKEKNLGVANSKNSAFHLMLGAGCEHVFVMEDDILMKYPKTCKAYADYAESFGVLHMNFALHGPMNVGKGKLFPGAECMVYPDCVGAFSYYHAHVFSEVGFMDEEFKNAWEHVEHTWRISKAKMTSPFWFFIDHILSAKMLEEIPGSIDNSSIRKRKDWAENIAAGQQHWMIKHGEFLPARPQGFYD